MTTLSSKESVNELNKLMISGISYMGTDCLCFIWLGPSKKIHQYSIYVVSDSITDYENILSEIYSSCLIIITGCHILFECCYYLHNFVQISLSLVKWINSTGVHLVVV